MGGRRVEVGYRVSLLHAVRPSPIATDMIDAIEAFAARRPIVFNVMRFLTPVQRTAHHRYESKMILYSYYILAIQP